MDRTSVGTNRWRGVERITCNTSGLRIPRFSIWSATMRSRCKVTGSSATRSADIGRTGRAQNANRKSASSRQPFIRSLSPAAALGGERLERPQLTGGNAIAVRSDGSVKVRQDIGHELGTVRERNIAVLVETHPLYRFTETAPIFQPSETEPGKVPLPLAFRSIFGPPDPYSEYPRHRECEPTEGVWAPGR